MSGNNYFLDCIPNRGYDSRMVERKQRKLDAFILKPRLFAILILIFVVLFMVLVSRFAISQIKKSHVAPDHGCSYEQGMRIMIHAKGYINTDLTYDGSYFQGGYPPKEIGVCTDVVWNGLRGLDVDLKSRIDQDVDEHFPAYASVISQPDPNIDFRLVPVQRVFYDRNAVSLTTDPSNLLAWQPGDFVVFEDEHIAVVSCLRNALGYPYLIQHGRDPAGDEDRIINDNELKITGHYRWPQTILIGGTNEESTDHN